MPDELIRIVVDNLQALRAVDGLAQALGRANMAANAVGSSLDASFQRATLTIDSAGNIIRSRFDLSAVQRSAASATTSMNALGQSVERSGGFMADFGRRAVGITMGIVVWRGLAGITDTISAMHTAISDLSAETVRFGLITGQSVGEARDSYLELQAVTTAQGILPSQAAPVVTTAARFAPGDTMGQQQLARGAAIFANLFGIAPERAINILTAALKQQGLEASDTMKILDQLIAVYSSSIGTVDEIANALTEATTIQQKWGTSYLETMGLVAEVSGAANESAETVVNSMVRITDVVERLEGDKAVEFARSFRDMGIAVQDATGELLDPLQIISNIAQSFDALTQEQQAQVFQMLGLLKPTYQQVGRALMQSLADGQISNLEVISGAGERAGKAFLDSYAGQLQKARALQEEVFQQGGVLAGFLSRIGTGLFEFVGEPQLGRQLNEALLTASIGNEETRDRFLNGMLGMDEQTVRQKVSETMQVAIDALRSAGPMAQGAWSQAVAGRSQAVDEAISRWRELRREATAQPRGMEGARAQAAEARQGAIQGRRGRDIEAPEGTTMSESQQRLRDIFLQKGAGAVLQDTAIDASKLSQDEFNSALRESESIYQTIMQAKIEEMRLAGLTESQIKKQVDAINEAVDQTFLLVELEGRRYDYVRGIQALYLREVLQEREQTKKQAEKEKPDFAFRRLRDVSPEQFPQLQALAQMYNQMLTNLGSPEKSQNINLLLGEQNVFKTLNVRMSALQMALEDLTKVEKAQLAGTWNLPAGATALVPISSLDIQRWNAQGGGGNIDWAALLGATNQSGDQITGAIGTSTREIVAAIMEGRITMAEGLKMAQDPKATALSLAEAIRGRTVEAQGRVGAGMMERDRIMAIVRSMLPARADDVSRRVSDTDAMRRKGLLDEVGPTAIPKNVLDMMQQVATRMSQVQGIGGRGWSAGGGGAKAVEQPPVNVRIEPIRTAITVTIPVMLNGQVIARVIAPILARMFARAAKTSTGTTLDLGAIR